MAFRFSPGHCNDGGDCGCGSSTCACGDFPCPDALGVGLTLTIETSFTMVVPLTYSSAAICPSWSGDSPLGVCNVECDAVSGEWRLNMYDGAELRYFTGPDSAGTYTCDPFHLVVDVEGGTYTVTT